MFHRTLLIVFFLLYGSMSEIFLQLTPRATLNTFDKAIRAGDCIWLEAGRPMFKDYVWLGIISPSSLSCRFFLVSTIAFLFSFPPINKPYNKFYTYKNQARLSTGHAQHLAYLNFSIRVLGQKQSAIFFLQSRRAFQPPVHRQMPGP